MLTPSMSVSDWLVYLQRHVYVCLSVGFKVSVHQVWYVWVVLLHALHQVYTNGYIQYHGERYITSITFLYFQNFYIHEGYGKSAIKFVASGRFKKTICFECQRSPFMESFTSTRKKRRNSRFTSTRSKKHVWKKSQQNKF